MEVKKNLAKENSKRGYTISTCEFCPDRAPTGFPLADPSPPLADPFASPYSILRQVISNPQGNQQIDYNSHVTYLT